MRIFVKNPHSILAALQARPKDIFEIHAPENKNDAWEEVIRVAGQAKCSVSKASSPVHSRAGGGSRSGAKEVDFASRASSPRSAAGGRAAFGGRRGRGDISGVSAGAGIAEPSGREREGFRQGGAGAWMRPKEGIPIEVLFDQAADRQQGRGLWLALDQLQDPQNVGAIFRSAAFFGVQGIVLTDENSASLTSTVYDVSSGGVESVPFSLQTNLSRSLQLAKDSGLWILGSSEHAKQELKQIQKDRPWLLVLGNEERGMRRLTEETCDLVCQIAPKGKVTSLNVSVAAGVMISYFT